MEKDYKVELALEILQSKMANLINSKQNSSTLRGSGFLFLGIRSRCRVDVSLFEFMCRTGLGGKTHPPQSDPSV